MAVRDYVVTVAIRSDLTWDDLGEAKRLGRLNLLDEDTRRGLGISDERRLWTFAVNAGSIREASEKAEQAVRDAFTGVDPDAEVVGLAWTGDSD
jgi:hypothetical protein